MLGNGYLKHKVWVPCSIVFNNDLLKHKDWAHFSIGFSNGPFKIRPGFTPLLFLIMAL